MLHRLSTILLVEMSVSGQNVRPWSKCPRDYPWSKCPGRLSVRGQIIRADCPWSKYPGRLSVVKILGPTVRGQNIRADSVSVVKMSGPTQCPWPKCQGRLSVRGQNVRADSVSVVKMSGPTVRVRSVLGIALCVRSVRSLITMNRCGKKVALHTNEEG